MAQCTDKESVDRHVGVIGLGLMGTAIAERLLEKGYQTTVWNRSPEKAAPLEQLGAVWSDNPLAECPRVIVSLYSSSVVAEVIGRMATGAAATEVIIDTTTGEPSDAVDLCRRLAERGVKYLGAPISGSSEQTSRGEATVIVDGEPADFAACADLWRVLGNKVFHVGPCGSATRMKLVTNLVLGLNRAALAEGLFFAESVGIRPEAALEVLQGSMAYSRIMETKGRKMIEKDFQPQARLSQHLKDVRLMLDAARGADCNLPLTEAHARLLEQAEAAGWGDLDNSAIINVYRPVEKGDSPSRPCRDVAGESVIGKGQSPFSNRRP